MRLKGPLAFKAARSTPSWRVDSDRQVEFTSEDITPGKGYQALGSPRATQAIRYRPVREPAPGMGLVSYPPLEASSVTATLPTLQERTSRYKKKQSILLYDYKKSTKSEQIFVAFEFHSHEHDRNLTNKYTSCIFTSW